MIKALVVLAVVCLVIATLPPIAVYLHFNNVFESYQLQISDLQQENEKLRKPYLTEAYLVTVLGWKLHNSSDPVPKSRYRLTIYGTVFNVGAKNASNCMLIIDFYNNTHLLQSSEIAIGEISCWSDVRIRRDVLCWYADSVTRIEVERTWTNTP